MLKTGAAFIAGCASTGIPYLMEKHKLDTELRHKKNLTKFNESLLEAFTDSKIEPFGHIENGRLATGTYDYSMTQWPISSMENLKSADKISLMNSLVFYDDVLKNNKTDYYEKISALNDMVYIYKKLGKEDQLQNTCSMIKNTLSEYKAKNIKDDPHFNHLVDSYIYNGTDEICKHCK